MKNNYTDFVIILLLVLFSRLIPHPPNFSPIIALAFYVTFFFGKRSFIILLMSFIMTDLVLGFYKGILFTWISIGLVSLLATQFYKNTSTRITGTFCSVILFFIITNTGVFYLDAHGENTSVFQNFTNALPFLSNSLVSTIGISLFIEYVYYLKIKKKIIKKII